MDYGEGTRLQHSGNVGGKIECRTVCERCRRGRAEWFAGDEARQKLGAAARKVPDNDVQLGASNQRILRLERLDMADRAVAPVCRENGDSWKT